MDEAVAEDGSVDVAGIADGVVRPLDPRYIDLQRQIGWIVSGILSILAGPGAIALVPAARLSLRAAGLFMAVLAAVLVLITSWLVRWPSVSYRYASYRVDRDGLEIRWGVYFRSVTTVPRSRVQHTDVSQGPLQRRYGLATLTVHTAGTENAHVALPGLPHDVALKIRDHLLPGNTADAV